MQLDYFFGSIMSTTALTSVMVALQDILTDIVFVVHLAKLIVCSYRKRLSSKHCLQALRVKLCCFYSYKRDRQNFADVLDDGNMLLNFYLNRRCQPAFMLAVDAVIKSWYAIAGLTVASRTAVLPARRKQFYYIAARSKLLAVKFSLFRRCR